MCFWTRMNFPPPKFKIPCSMIGSGFVISLTIHTRFSKPFQVGNKWKRFYEKSRKAWMQCTNHNDLWKWNAFKMHSSLSTFSRQRQTNKIIVICIDKDMQMSRRFFRILFFVLENQKKGKVKSIFPAFQTKQQSAQSIAHDRFIEMQITVPISVSIGGPNRIWYLTFSLLICILHWIWIGFV